MTRRIVPICCICAKFRNRQGVWQDWEGYAKEYLNVKFSHSYCPECMEDQLIKFNSDENVDLDVLQ